MSLRIAPFAAGHLDGAAALLATRQRAQRGYAPHLPERFENPAAVRPLLEEALAMDGADSVVALRDDTVAGYLIGRIVLGHPVLRPRAGWVDYAGHAVDPEDGAETYRMLYSAVAPRWLAAGCFAHYVMVPATDRQALAAWFSLGFGQDDARGIRDLAPPADRGPVPGIAVQRSGEERSERVFRLLWRLALYHTGAPVFEALTPERRPELRRLVMERLADPARPVFLAMRGGDAVAMLALSPPTSRAAMVTPERCIHIDDAYTEPALRGGGIGSLLLDAALAWARDAGLAWCSVNWRTANLAAARFWRVSGVRPVLYRLTREADPRVAWAKPALAED